MSASRPSPPLSSSGRSSSLDRTRQGDADDDDGHSSPGTSPCSSLHLYPENHHSHARAAGGGSAGAAGAAGVGGGGGGRKASVSLQLFKESADDQLDLVSPSSSGPSTSRADFKGSNRASSSAVSAHTASPPSRRLSTIKVTASPPKPSPSSSSSGLQIPSSPSQRTSDSTSADQQTHFSLPSSVFSTSVSPLPSSSSSILASSVSPSSKSEYADRLVPSEIVARHANPPFTSTSTSTSAGLDHPAGSPTLPSADSHAHQPNRLRNHKLPEMNASVSESIPLRRKSFKIVSSPLSLPHPSQKYSQEPRPRSRRTKDSRKDGEKEIDWVGLELKEELEEPAPGEQPPIGATEASLKDDWDTTSFFDQVEQVTEDSSLADTADESDRGLESDDGKEDESEGAEYDYELDVGSMDIGSMSSTPQELHEEAEGDAAR
jgi:hypothetical protein